MSARTVPTGHPGWISVSAAAVAALLAAVSSAAEPLDLRHVPARAVAAVVVHPQQLAQSPELQLLPWEVLQALGRQEWGLDPLQVTRGVALAGIPDAQSPPDWGLVLTFGQPQQAPADWLERSEAVTVGQLTYRRLPGRPGVCFYQADERTLLIGSEPMLRDMLTAADAASPLREVLAGTPLRNDITAVVAVNQLRGLIKQGLAQAPPLPPPLQPLLKVPDQLETVMIALNLSSDRVSGIKLVASDEAAAQQLETTLRQTLAFAKQMLLGQLMQSTQQERMDPAVAQGLQQYLIRIANMVEGRLQPVRTGNELLITLKADYATSGVLVALLLPAVQAAREAARRTQSMNNLKQLMLAMHNYHDVYKHFPAAYSSSADGRPLLSWRVHLLPFLEQRPLYEQFRLDEPWDSPHNRQLIPQMPELFRSPNSAAPPGTTTYLGIYGPDMILIPPRDHPERRPVGTRLAEITDGTSNTAVILETGDALAVEWTRPADYEPDPANPLEGLLGTRPGGFLIGMADGSVRFISQSIDREMLMRIFTRGDGQPVRFD